MHFKFRGIATLVLVASLVTLEVCGCVSGSETSSEATTSTTTDTTNTTNTTSTASEAYTQSGGTETSSNQAFTASNTDENGIKVTNGGTFTLSNSTVTKTGDTSSNDNSDFYGLNAGVLAESGSAIELTNCTVTTNANGANGVFSTGSGSSVTLSNVTINTSADGSRGVDATQTGNITCTDVNITTVGQHCAAIATDRGNGTITVIGGTMSNIWNFWVNAS